MIESESKRLKLRILKENAIYNIMKFWRNL